MDLIYDHDMYYKNVKVASVYHYFVMHIIDNFLKIAKSLNEKSLEKDIYVA